MEAMWSETVFVMLTFETVLDADDDKASCDVVALHDSKVIIQGMGILTSRVLQL